MERQEHNQGLKDTFTEEFGEWENCINATIKETPKHKFIRSLPGCNSREIDSGKPPLDKSALQKPTSQIKLIKNSKRELKWKRWSEFESLATSYSNTTPLLINNSNKKSRRQKWWQTMIKYMYNLAAPTIYSDFVSSTLPNGLTKHTANQIVTRADDKIKSSRQEKANETFISRICWETCYKKWLHSQFPEP